MSQYAALLIIMVICALGDFIGTFSKAAISTMFVIMACFLILFMTGILPPDICEISGLASLSGVAVQFLIVDMGSSVELSVLKREWRTVATAAIALVVAVLACFAVIPIVGKEAAFVGAPVINGGIVAATTMVDAAEEHGLPICAALAAFIYAVQKFVGTLPCSNFGRKYAQKLIEEYRSDTRNMDNEPTGRLTAEKKPFWQRHEKYYTSFFCIGIAAVCVYLSVILGELTHGWIGKALWSMFIGILLRNTGLVKGHFLRDQGKAAGFFSFLTMVTMIPALAKIDISMLPEIGFSALVIFAAVIGATLLVFLCTPAWKLCGSKQLAIGISMCQMIGYPGTQLISDEICKAIGRTPEEVDYLSEKIGTAYVISGFTTVTILSVFVANFLSRLL